MINAVKIPETWHFFFHFRREGLSKMLPFEEGFITYHIETKNNISNSVKKFCCPVEKYRIQYIIFETFVRGENLYTCPEKNRDTLLVEKLWMWQSSWINSCQHVRFCQLNSLQTIQWWRCRTFAIIWSELVFLPVWETALPSCRSRAPFLTLS